VSPRKTKGKTMNEIKELSCQFLTMTKERVDSMIESNTSNRNLRSRVVDAYARDMTSGHWETTHQGIAISSCGKVIDGQHRLHALKKSGYPPIKMLVVTGLKFEVQKYVDQQAKRNIRDVLRVSFDANFSHHAPAIARLLIGIDQSEHINPTASEIADKVGEYMDEIEIITNATKSKKSFFAAAYLAGFVRVLKENPEREPDILAFVKSVQDGVMLTKLDPAFHLRSFLINTKGSSQGGSMIKERYLKTVKATNAHLEGKTMGVLRA
jgi:hypothetical protein